MSNRKLVYLMLVCWGAGTGIRLAGEEKEIAETLVRQLTQEAGRNSFPTWTPDGEEIVYASGGSLFQIAVSGSGRPRRLAFAGETASEPSISLHNNRLVFVQAYDDRDIYRQSLPPLIDSTAQPSEPEPFALSTRQEYQPSIPRMAFVSRSFQIAPLAPVKGNSGFVTATARMSSS